MSENIITTSESGELTERQEKAFRLHKQIIANERIVAQSLVEVGRDLKTMRDEKLYTEIGCESFGDYCEQRAGIKERQGYNFVAVYERFGERLNELQSVGITKLLEIAKLDDEDAEEIIESGELEGMSVRELKEKCEEYKKRCEQLTLEIEEKLEETDGNDDILAENERLKSELERTRDYNLNIDANFQKSERLRIEAQRKNRELESRIKELEEKPVDIAVQKPSDEEIKKIKDKAKKDAEKAAKAAFEDEKKKLDDELSAYRAELVKLEAEKAELQSIAKKPPLDDSKAKVKFFLGEVQKDFNSALGAIDEIDSEDEREKLRAGMGRLIEQMKATLE